MEKMIRDIPNEGVDFSHAIDPRGLAIHYSIRGQEFLFNGNSGSFYTELPDYVKEALQAVPTAQDTQSLQTELERLRQEYGEPSHEWLDYILSLHRGDHPELAEENHQTSFGEAMEPHLMNIYVSQGCNLGCNYCFNQGGTFGGKSSLMKMDTAKDVLSFILNIAKTGRHKRMGINLFGGEPLLNPKVVHYLARGLMDFNLADNPTKINIILSTNGTIYEPEVFSIFKEMPERAVVAISLDGSKQNHDKNRPFLKRIQDSSFDIIAANIKKIVENDIPHSVTCVVSKPFDFIGMSKMLHEMKVKKLEIKQLNYHIHGKDDLPETFEREFNQWRTNYIDYSDYHLDYMDGPHLTHVDRFYKFFDFARKYGKTDGLAQKLACGVADDKVGIAADGNIFPCEAFLRHDEFIFGHVKSGFDQEKFAGFQKWILKEGQNRIDHPKCKDCFAKKMCGGGCYAESFDRDGTLESANLEQCDFIRETLKVDLYYLSETQKRYPKKFLKLMNSD
jgi:uncharacterized protein